MSKKNKTIPVLDSDNRFLSNTTPAKARMMLKSRDCSVFSDNPFMIKKNGELKETMVKRKTKTSSNFITNWTKFFAEEAEIYIQNLTTTNISLQLNQDGDILSISIPCTRKPLNLTQFATFDSIKNSVQLRKMVNRKPAALRLVTEDEYNEYFENLAEKYGTEVEDEMREAQDQFSALMNKREYTPSDMEKNMVQSAKEIEESFMQASEPDPRIVGLCERASEDQGKDRINQRQVLDELEVYETELKPEDWDYIASHIPAGYKQVKSYTLKMMQDSAK